MSDAGSSPDETTENGGSNTNVVTDRTVSQAFDLLASHRRRAVITALQARPDGVASVDDLANDLQSRDPDFDDHDRIVIGLYHETLPRLADSGVVEFDPRSDTVRYQGHDVVEDLLTVIANRYK